MLDGSYWGPAQLHPSRLSRSVSAQEFNTDTVERCVRAGQSVKTDGRVRLGRQSATAAIVPSGGPPHAPTSRSVAANGCVLATSSCVLLTGLNTSHTSGPVPATDGAAAAAAAAGSCIAANFPSCSPPPPLLPSQSCFDAAAVAAAAEASAAECKQHGGGRSEAMDRRVRGGRLLRSQSKDPNFVSALSLLDVMGPAGPHTPRSETSNATCPEPPPSEHCPATSPGGGGCLASSALTNHHPNYPNHQLPHHGQTLGASLGRLYSLDSATLHQLDRALSGAVSCGGSGGGGMMSTSPVPFGPATASAPPPGGLAAAAAAGIGAGGRIYKVRPLGAVASSLSLHSATCPLGSPFSRCNSTLLDFAEEQASLAAVQQSLGGGGGAAAAAASASMGTAASLSGRVDYLSLLSSDNNSVGGGDGCGAGGAGSCFVGYSGSFQSSAAGSLSVSPNPQQPHVSLASLLGAATAAAANSRTSSGGGYGSGGSSSLAAAAAAAAAGCLLPLHSSLPADVGRQGRALAAPDMRLFPFSSPEDFYMAATVLLDAKLPGTLSGDCAASLQADGAPRPE